VYPPDKFNAGVLLIRPNKSIFKDMMQKIAALPSHDGGDTGFLNSYYPEWYAGDSQTHLAFGYNAQRIVHWMTFDKQPGYWSV
jgi:glycogenin glucosyltransferase